MVLTTVRPRWASPSFRSTSGEKACGLGWRSPTDPISGLSNPGVPCAQPPAPPRADPVPVQPDAKPGHLRNRLLPGSLTPSASSSSLLRHTAAGGPHSAIMASLDGKITQPVPRAPSNPSADGRASPPSSASSSSEAESEGPRKPRMERPRLTGRQKSSTIIVPKGPDVIQTYAEYPPDDARAMSPRRNSADLEKLGQEARQSLKE